jgi:hypothetical protein
MEQLEVTKADRFAALTQGIRELIAHNKLGMIEKIVTKYAQSDESETRKLLLRSIVHYLRMEHRSCLELLMRAGKEMAANEFPEDTSIFSLALAHSQLALSRRERPATAMGFTFYRKNIAALQRVDPELAEEVQRCDWPKGFQLLQYWSGLHLFYADNQTLLTLGGEIQDLLNQHINTREPITFSGIGTGQELIYCLKNQIDLLYGMTRAHYLFEPEVEKIKLLLHMYEFSPYFSTHELIFFGGSNLLARRAEIFGSLRYFPPRLIVGPMEPIQEHAEAIKGHLINPTVSEQVERYYASEEFLDRQRRIAAGQILPRIFVATGRWTTFLKHCAKDFERAFSALGSQSRYFIEENDVQNLTPALYWRELDRFKPDVLFSVSHARPTSAFIPEALPVIAYIQDKCGPILWLPELSEHIRPWDLFVCSLSEFQKYLWSKNVPTSQTFVMPVPTDETIFYPLDPDDPLLEHFGCDISYVKHGNADVEKDMNDWMKPKGLIEPENSVDAALADCFGAMYRCFEADPQKRWYEDDMHEYARQKVGNEIYTNYRQALAQMVTTFSVQVYPTFRRRYYLRALAQSGISLRLYGKGWERDPEFSVYAAGSVERGPQLNAVYNFSRINLHLHPYSTMHQRLSECGLAGGFMMVADHPPEKDWESVRAYFEEDKEAVFFHTSDDLVERCRYYLAHPEKRLEIAHHMYRRAIRERTCKAGAETVLAKWRELLRQNHD